MHIAPVIDITAENKRAFILKGMLLKLRAP